MRDSKASGEADEETQQSRRPAPAVRLADLDRAQRRRALALTSASVVASWILIFGAYFILPIGHESGIRQALRLAAVVALIGAVFVWQIRRIAYAELPELRAVEALGVVIALFLVFFSAIYLSMAHGNAGNFSESLDHVKAVYMTITIFSTVGFGDITPRTDGARLVVSAQMLLDLVIIGVGVRLLFNVAKNRISTESSPTDPA